MTSEPSVATTAKLSPVSIGSHQRSCWTLYWLTLRQHFYGRRWWVVAALFLLPVGLSQLVRWTEPDVPSNALEFIMVFMFIPQALLPLVALLYASGIIQDEQEEQTITYLLIRPISKWAIYLIKLIATLTTTVSLVAIFTVLTYVAIYSGADNQPVDLPTRCLKAVAIHSLAVVAYCSLFGLMSLLTKRILVVGIIYIAVVEGLLANLPFGIRLVTVIYYTRLIAYRTLDFMVSRPRGGSEDIANEAWQLNIRLDPKLLEHPQLSTCLLVLIVGSIVCAILAAWLCTQREFHVKTPEKA
jgi:ABC-2 type transport system permease protein